MEEYKRCRICHGPIKNRENETDVHPDCELKQDLEYTHKRTRHDGTGQDEEGMMEELMRNVPNKSLDTGRSESRG